jgi:hypothetical protein
MLRPHRPHRTRKPTPQPKPALPVTRHARYIQSDNPAQRPVQETEHDHGPDPLNTKSRQAHRHTMTDCLSAGDRHHDNLQPYRRNAGISESTVEPPPAAIKPQVTERAPRTRGDGPFARLNAVSRYGCSPHPRGWSLGKPVDPPKEHVLPAPAGMVPAPGPNWPTSWCAPRTRGDGPPVTPRCANWSRCSPHPRGWSRGHLRRADAGLVLPAPAGMVPVRSAGRAGRASAPRTREDGPAVIFGAGLAVGPRGWSRRRARGDNRRGVLLHPRGWSLRSLEDQILLAVLPALAGMVPPALRLVAGSSRTHRTRGDGPATRTLQPKTCSPFRSRGPALGHRRRQAPSPEPLLACCCWGGLQACVPRV